MEAIIYVIIFIIGALFGSFYTLATYRIPRHQDITHTRSYCPKCNHKLGFFDMFPIFSYIFLGGKCRYCKNKISPRYLILEVFSGLIFVSMFFLMKIDIYNIDVKLLIKFGFMSLFLSYLFITAWIDKENKIIENKVTVFGITISLLYIAYLCIVEQANIYKYAMYMCFYALILITDITFVKHKKQDNYIAGIMFALITMGIFTGEKAIIYTLCIFIAMLILYMCFEWMDRYSNKSPEKHVPLYKKVGLAYYLCIANIISIFAILLQEFII